MNYRDAFENALQLIKVGRYKLAKLAVKNNPPSDQRIIERRIEQAMANDANRNDPIKEQT